LLLDFDMKWILPQFDGTLTVGRIPDDFFSRIAERVRVGFFVRGNRKRANYSIRRSERYDVHFSAADFLTAFNVGLNEVRVFRVDGERIGYSVTYWRWTLYAVVLSAAIALPMIAGFLLLPSFSDQAVQMGPLGVGLFWGMVAFWGFVWPWVLTAMHKRFAARCLENILRDELAQSNR